MCIPMNNKECEMTLASKTLTVAALVLAGASAGLSGAEAKPIQSGGASWYGPGFHGRKTASGERFNTHALTAAHRSLPFGTRLEVTNLENDRSVVVRVNDRGPFVRGRIVDLSLAAAKALGMAKDGVTRVRLRPLQ